jgi:hypothetical protein
LSVPVGTGLDGKGVEGDHLAPGAPPALADGRVFASPRPGLGRKAAAAFTAG